MNFSLSNETALIEASILAVLMAVLICFVIHIRVVSKLARNIDVAGSQASLVAQFEKSLRDANEELRKGLGELDQGLRSAVSTGMKDGLARLIHRMSGILWRVSPKLLILFRDWVSRPSIHTITPSHTRHGQSYDRDVRLSSHRTQKGYRRF